VTTLAPTLSTRYFSRTAAWLRDLSLIVLGALLVATLAQVIIPLPFTPVPLTGQTFAVLLVGAALGSKRGIASLALYTVMGALGLPFFAGGASGLVYLSGPTLGYLVGFIAAAYVIRMYLFGTWHPRILRVIVSPGTLMGRERLGYPHAGMGTVSRQVRSKPVALFGLPAYPNLGWRRTPHRTTPNVVRCK
jgi:hypothetical protein